MKLTKKTFFLDQKKFFLFFFWNFWNFMTKPNFLSFLVSHQKKHFVVVKMRYWLQKKNFEVHREHTKKIIQKSPPPPHTECLCVGGGVKLNTGVLAGQISVLYLPNFAKSLALPIHIILEGLQYSFPSLKFVFSPTQILFSLECCEIFSEAKIILNHITLVRNTLCFCIWGKIFGNLFHNTCEQCFHGSGKILPSL